jgi:hypothetical protein
MAINRLIRAEGDPTLIGDILSIAIMLVPN